MSEYFAKEYGAVGDGETDETEAVQETIDAASSDGGGTVVIGSGDYELRPIELFDHITLRLEAGATLKASPELTDYAHDDYPLTGLIRAQDAAEIAITGRGVIDGRGMTFLDPESRRKVDLDSPLSATRQGEDFSAPRFGTADGPANDPDDRPDRLFVLQNCSNVRVNGVTIVDSPSWTLHLLACSDVHISDLTIDNNLLIPNSDGIIPDMSTDVTIVGCTIRAGDDAIVLKATGMGTHRQPCERIVVGDCTLVSRSSAIKVGSSTYYDIRDCVFSNLIIHHSNRALGIQHRDAGTVRDILFSNIDIHTRLHTGHWWGQAEPIWITSLPRHDGAEVGGVRDVTFRHIESNGEGGVVIDSAPESRLENISLDGVNLRLTPSKHGDAVGGNFDYRPDNRTTANQGLFEHDIPAIYVGNARDVTLQEITVEWGSEGTTSEAELPAYYSNAVEATDVSALTIDRLVGRGAHNQPVISLVDCQTVSILHSQTTEGASLFLESEHGDYYRRFFGNDLTTAAVSSPVLDAFATTGSNIT